MIYYHTISVSHFTTYEYLSLNLNIVYHCIKSGYKVSVSMIFKPDSENIIMNDYGPSFSRRIK